LRRSRKIEQTSRKALARCTSRAQHRARPALERIIALFACELLAQGRLEIQMLGNAVQTTDYTEPELLPPPRVQRGAQR
jgi:hypothetical protein